MTEYKMAVIGEGGVGRSALVSQFTRGHFVEEYDPTIEDYYRKQVVIDEETCLLDVLDTAGRDEYTMIRDQLVLANQGFLCVYSITSRHSFEVVSALWDDILQVNHTKQMPFVLVGNKIDLESAREVSTTEGQELAKQWQVPFFETSAKTQVNVAESFTELVRQIKKAELAGSKPTTKQGKHGKCSIL